MEIEVVPNQIQPAMTLEQLAAIKEMCLTPHDMPAMGQELSLSDQRAGGTALIDTLIELLEARAGE